MNTRLPISNYEPTGRGYYYDYWINYCNGDPNYLMTKTVKALEADWGGKLYNTIDATGQLPYIEFQSPEQLILFMLRWS